MRVIATAGQAGSGKTALVRRLTGMPPLLGTSWTALSSGRVLEFVDMPAGTTFTGLCPVAAVLFVVAADPAWTSQSAEHLTALQALGIRHGLLVITKSDLADPLPALCQARAELAGTALVSAEVVVGTDGLRPALDRLAER